MTSKSKYPTAQALAANKPAPSRPLTHLKTPTAGPGQDLEARRALIARFATVNPRTTPAPELAAAINELHRAGASLTNPHTHIGRQLLYDLTRELERRQSLADARPVPDVPARAGGYYAAAVGVFGAEAVAKLVRTA